MEEHFDQYCIIRQASRCSLYKQFIYLRYVTGTLKDVVREVLLPWNLETPSITVSTDSVVGSNELVYVYFSDKYGNTAGSVDNNTQIEYAVESRV